MPIRKGDGVSLAPNGIQEVRKGDGTVIYSASTVTTVDDFEDGDIAEYSGDTGAMTVQTGTVYSGSYALQLDTDGTFKELVSATGLNAYPQAGDIFEAYHRLGGVNDGPVYNFGTQAENRNDCYQVGMRGNDDTFVIHEISGGNATSLGSTSVPFSNHANEWLNSVTEWGSDGTITITIYDSTNTEIGNLTVTSTAYTSGGIGWCGNTADASSTLYHDYMEITGSI